MRIVDMLVGLLIVDDLNKVLTWTLDVNKFFACKLIPTAFIN